MKKQRVAGIVVVLLFCVLSAFACQYILNDCFWWECVPERDFHVLDWELPASLFAEGTDLKRISPSSEGAGEIERGSQSIFWDSGNGIAIYRINRYPTLKKAIWEFQFTAGHLVDDVTKNPWIRPSELTLFSSTADEMLIACGDWMGRRCGMLARYQEYVIFFNATMDEKMTYSNLEKILIYIDEQISSRLYP